MYGNRKSNWYLYSHCTVYSDIVKCTVTVYSVHCLYTVYSDIVQCTMTLYSVQWHPTVYSVQCLFTVYSDSALHRLDRYRYNLNWESSIDPQIQKLLNIKTKRSTISTQIQTPILVYVYSLFKCRVNLDLKLKQYLFQF